MRGIDIAAQARDVSRILGVEVIHEDGPAGRSFYTEIPSAESGQTTKFEVRYRLPSQAQRALKMLHSDVYRARGEMVWRQQGFKCCFCGKVIRNFEIDHIESRGAHGRSDEISNLRACCTGLSGCGLHRARHGG